MCVSLPLLSLLSGRSRAQTDSSPPPSALGDVGTHLTLACKPASSSSVSPSTHLTIRHCSRGRADEVFPGGDAALGRARFLSLFSMPAASSILALAHVGQEASSSSLALIWGRYP